jgi:hypothetical protein
MKKLPWLDIDRHDEGSSHLPMKYFAKRRSEYPISLEQVCIATFVFPQVS